MAPFLGVQELKMGRVPRLEPDMVVRLDGMWTARVRLVSAYRPIRSSGQVEALQGCLVVSEAPLRKKFHG
jgi:hypothetical protein